MQEGPCRAAGARYTGTFSGLMLIPGFPPAPSFRHRGLFHGFPSTRDEKAPVPTSSSPLQSDTSPRLQEGRTAAAAKLTSAGSAGAAATPASGCSPVGPRGVTLTREQGEGGGEGGGQDSWAAGGDLR